MEDRVRISILMDYYKELLTEKQKDIMELYFNEDLSLAEISEITNTSRQAIYDIIKRCNKLLDDYEDKLKLFEKSIKSKKNKEIIIEKLTLLEKDTNKKECLDLLKEIKVNIIDSI
ncbi:putative DNA-binding protein [Clostridium homopropionicum DSM 5847]|uniref:UPF0122 protein CLHOM_11400 n=1 Tax=Clostridium homopropionicum DSM 5847 TaxID=1121318 RepID=A0A0L6ZC72_9CLOT|nr:putative DNA-binding protein [Clostridium homopropionicum]KOA20552.1 putative DNA-binding protein [Clostridium homopropionicum DSM 5847]SFG38544.1 hypothetical protein SAMN04488501_108145 [Clostridium homopropionicum]